MYRGEIFTTGKFIFYDQDVVHVSVLSQMVRKLSQEKRKAPAKINNGVPRLRGPRPFKNTTGFGSTDYKLISVKFVIQKLA